MEKIREFLKSENCLKVLKTLIIAFHCVNLSLNLIIYKNISYMNFIIMMIIIIVIKIIKSDIIAIFDITNLIFFLCRNQS